MSRASVVCLVIGLCHAGFTVAEIEPRLETHVIGLQCLAYSGPGMGYYPTLALRPGQKVVLVGKLQGDWLTIEPPTGSFSWVPAEGIELLPDGTARVSVESLDAKVGSIFSDARYVHQITLKKGDAVQILDEVTLRDAAKSMVWFKILPPPNERRYIRASDVKLPQPVVPSILEPPSTSDGSAAAAAAKRQTTPTATTRTIWAVGTRVIPPARPIRRASHSRPEKPRLASTVIVPIVDNPNQSFEQRLESLQKQVDLMQTRIPETWDLETATRVADEMRRRPSLLPAQQQQLDSVSEQLQNLADFKQRFEQWSRDRAATLQQDQELTIHQRRLEEQLLDRAPRFDAAGILNRAVLQIDNQPTFVLQTAAGETTHYVIPAPGLNLTNYVGLRVGLMGELKKQNSVPAPVVIVRQLVPQS